MITLDGRNYRGRLWMCFLLYCSMSSLVLGILQPEECTTYESELLKLCTPRTNLTFHLRTNGTKVPFYTRETACQIMKKRGIVKFDIHGDSFMRHLTQSLMLVFSGDLESGSLSERGKQFKECAGDRQFDEKGCFVNDTVPVDGHLKYVQEEPFCAAQNHTVMIAYSGAEVLECNSGSPHDTIRLFSSGNHALTPGADTINNSTATITYFTGNGVCRRDNLCAPAAFVSTHHRMNDGFQNDGHQEFAEVERFNIEMRAFIEDGGCGAHVGFVDVFNITKSLVHNLRYEASLMTYDGVHWSRTVNLLKAQIILHHFLG